MKTDGLLSVLFILFHVYSYKNKWSTNVTFYYYIKPNFRSHSCKINNVAVLWAATLHAWWSRIMHIKLIYNSQLSFRRDKTIKFPGRKHFCLYWHQNEAVKWTQMWIKSKNWPFWAPQKSENIHTLLCIFSCLLIKSTVTCWSSCQKNSKYCYGVDTIDSQSPPGWTAGRTTRYKNKGKDVSD